MEYGLAPRDVELADIVSRDYILAPSSLRFFRIKNKNTKPLRGLITSRDKGKEVGSFAYVSKSSKFFIRNKALKKGHWIIFTKGTEEIIPINPLSFINSALDEGDILISKDSNIGECAILPSAKYKQDYMISGGMNRLKIDHNRLYIFSIMKSNFFREQIHSLTPRGATLKHAKELYLDCIIPFPNGKNAQKTKERIESLAQQIISNEQDMLSKYQMIIQLVKDELEKNQNKATFSYSYPDLIEIERTYRLDASIYCEDYKKNVFFVKNYSEGYSTLRTLGFKEKRGSSLEIKGLGARADSETAKSGFKALILPTNISEYGTLEKIEYIGVKKDLVKVNRWDIVFGGEATRRLFVLCEKLEDAVTNYHGIKIYKETPEPVESIFIWAFLSYWKDIGVLDHIAVGGQGGHLAPEYFDYLTIPKFPSEIKKKIAHLYYNDKSEDGVYQLHLQNKKLESEIDILIKKIVDDESV
ncbi:hypothetical protein COU37_02980 [Candidatus Micrarchaeota archaeon CG10_big_fil_rev_8_21_14_0_10_45_29]|nr:MAG: hypothetical protein COU37_02980 [Candidatus Micrarchaeota archaeon CG10_big_fil_rev_8_21_14_0_10_45_29]QBM01542.1 hypothetical protein [uncultured archaeon]